MHEETSPTSVMYGIAYRTEVHEHPDTGRKSLVYVPECCGRRYESLKVMSWAHMGPDGETQCPPDRSLERLLENAPDPAAIPPAELLDGLPAEAEMFFSMQLRADWTKSERRRAYDLTRDWTRDQCRLFAERLGGRLPSRIRWPLRHQRIAAGEPPRA